MAAYGVFGNRRSQVVLFELIPSDDGTLATAAVADVIAAHKCENAWYSILSGHTAENTAGTGIDSFADPTGVDGDPPALNPDTPPA